jgi:hypothetical protein
LDFRRFPGERSAKSRRLLPVDKIRFRIDIARMVRRALAFVLVLSWFALASTDVLEDLGLYHQAKLNSRLDAGGLANDIVESAADTLCACATWLSDQAAFPLSAFTWAPSPRTSKLHKLHHIYQI